MQIIKNGKTSMTQKSISLCMIVKNEENNLRDCLNSIKEYVDEIVVVDTGSTDRTLKIAEEMGAKTSTYIWNDDFSAARNASIELATCSWILWLDADDRIPAGQEAVIDEAKSYGAKGYIVKPFEKQQVIDEIQKILGK